MEAEEPFSKDLTNTGRTPEPKDGGSSDEDDADNEEKEPVKEGTFINFLGKNSIVMLKESLFAGLKYISSCKKPDLGRTDHPELYANINRQFDV